MDRKQWSLALENDVETRWMEILGQLYDVSVEMACEYLQMTGIDGWVRADGSEVLLGCSGGGGMMPCANGIHVGGRVMRMLGWAVV